jgi:peroxiredoxin/predicted 2-oxoglutarate/Fe(II)-dependent dioxygenase YbiX
VEIADHRIPGPGEPAPWFHARCVGNPRFGFDSVAGRYVVLCLFGSAAHAASRQVLGGFLQHRARFDDENCCFFGVSVDPQDEAQGRVRDQLPGVRFFWDFDHAVSRAYGAVSASGEYRPLTLLLDPRLRVLATWPVLTSPETHAERVIGELTASPPVPGPHPAAPQAPVLVVPRVFEPEFCRQLIALYERHGGSDSGFMRDVDGKTVGVVDHGFKRRRDYEISEQPVRTTAMHRIHDRLAPEIHKAFQFRATRMERYLVACYDAQTGGHFHAHRDNTTRGTAHRRFACSINLNAEEFEGGDLRFPEFGRQTYRPPTGGAVVFSCSLLHEATPVTRGKRYAFLPFLYDEEGARVRQANREFVADAAGSAPETTGGAA